MKSNIAKLLLLPFLLVLAGQVSAQIPEYGPLPKKFGNLPQELSVNHYPNPLLASTDESQKEFKYFWKHTTSVVSLYEDVEISEFGAYIYYNNQWNERVSLKPKDFEKMFNCPGAVLKKGEPYTFPDNWRKESELRGGWAMWYFIGKNESGKKVAGTGKLYTVGGTYKESHYRLDPEQSSIQWTGHAARTSYSPSGEMKFKSGDLLMHRGVIYTTRVEADLTTLTSSTKGIAKHLMSADFFDAVDLPSAVFELNDWIDMAAKPRPVQGKFSFHGRAIVLRFPLTIEEINGEIVATGTITLDRTQFGINKGSPDHEDDLTDQSAIANDFEVKIKAVFVK